MKKFTETINISPITGLLDEINNCEQLSCLQKLLPQVKTLMRSIEREEADELINSYTTKSNELISSYLQDNEVDKEKNQKLRA